MAASNFSPMFFEQPIVIFDTTASESPTSGSFVLYGGMSVNADYQSDNVSSGAFILSGGIGVQKKLNVGGITHVYAEDESEGVNSGALIVDGGVGIAKNLHVGADTFIAGNLYVNGLTTSVNSTTINVVDNTFTLNSGPAGSRDAGFLIQRYQTAVDDGSGDVVGGNEPVVFSGSLLSGGTNSITFATTDSALNPDGWWIKVTSGANIYARKVSPYSTNITGVVTVSFTDEDSYTDPQGVSQLTHNDKPFTSTVSAEDSFALYNRNYVAQYYDEANDEYIMGYISHAHDIQTTLQKTDLLNIRSKGLYATNSIITNLEVTSLSAGNIGLDQATILSTFVVTGTTTLASLMVSGGSQVGGTLTVSGGSVLNQGVTAGSLFVTEGSLLQGSLGVSGATLLGGDLTVTGASVFYAGATAGSLFVSAGSLLQGSLGVSGATLLGNDLTVTGASVFYAGATAASLFVSAGSLLQGSLGVSGATLLGGDLTVTGASVFYAGATAASLFVSAGSLLQGSLGVSGATLLGGDLTVTGASVFYAGATAASLFVSTGSLLQGSLGVSGATLLGGDLTVTGASVFYAGATAASLFVSAGSLLQGSLGVSGATLLGGDLTVTGASVFYAGATAASLFVSAGSLLQGDLGVSGGTLLRGDLTVSGASIFNNGITAGSLNVTGESTLHANVTMGSNAVVVGPAFQIPFGDVASRPTPAQDGYIRYNTEYSSFEGFGPGDSWGSLGGVIDIAQSTKILASASPNITDGNLYFYTVGTEYMRLNSAGNIGIHTTAPNYTLDVIGTLGVSVGITAGSLNVTGASIMEDNFTVTTGSVTVSTNDYTPILGATSATGGSIIFNTVDVSPSMGDISRERKFVSANNVSEASSITGFAFSNAIVRAFDAVVSVTILSSAGNKYAYYNLKGVQKGSNWVINSSYVGDVTGYTFSITDAGQVKYTSTDITGWSSASVNFRALTTTL